MTRITFPNPILPILNAGIVVQNTALCREHLRLSFRLERFGPASPGQFVHLCPVAGHALEHIHHDGGDRPASAQWADISTAPMLRRAFSIAGLRRRGGAVEIDVIYRIVGTATRWMASLRQADKLSVLGPLGNVFPIHGSKRGAWLVAGGVGLPPMLWLSKAMQDAGKETIAFCGARSADLLPLSLDPTAPPAADASYASYSAGEFAAHGASVVLSTDDGSLGFHGRIGDALAAFHRTNPASADDVVVYTCGPEPMMRAVAEYCLTRKIDGYACMERNMACGTGLCQSCVVPVHDPADAAGWRYRLCCTDGPVFDVREIIFWEQPR